MFPVQEAIEKLRELKETLDRAVKEHLDALNREPTISRPLNDAVAETHRRLRMMEK